MASCPWALHNNYVDQIQRSELFTMIENLTPTALSSQEINFEILNRHCLVLKNSALPLLFGAPPNSQ